MEVRTVGDLVALLEQYDQDLQVRVAFQPSWPLRARLVDVVSSDELVGELEATGTEDQPWDIDDVEEGDRFLWLAIDQPTDGEHPYAPKAVWRDGRAWAER